MFIVFIYYQRIKHEHLQVRYIQINKTENNTLI